MAIVLDTPLPKRTGGHRKPIYPYDEWLDGQVRMILKGVDFTATVPSMRSSLSGEATNRGLKLATRALPKDPAERKALGLKPSDEGFIFQSAAAK